MSVGDNLIKIMELQNHNPSTLAKISGVPQPRIYEIVSNKTKNPQLKTLQKLAKALSVSVDILTQEEQIASVNEQIDLYGFSEDTKELQRIFNKMPENKRKVLLDLARLLGEK